MSKLRDPISSLTHFIPFLVAIPLLVLMTRQAQSHRAFLAALVFGVTLMGLYGGSALYHAVKGPEKLVAALRKVDHMMIFALIAGTYTPVCLLAIPAPWGKRLLIAVWSVALVGMLMKVFWMNAPRWLYTAVYVLMGWMVLGCMAPLWRAVSLPGLAWLVSGGLIYTLGAVIYGMQPSWLDFKKWNSHDIFHLFVIGGSLCHIIFIIFYIL